MIEPPATTSTALFKGGPTLIDLLVDVTELRIALTGPRMLFERLELVTTLSALDGCTVQQLRQLAGCLEGTIHCGLVGVQHAGIQVETLRSGGSLQIDLGPPSMYQSELVMRTRTGETFRALVQRLLVSDPSRPFVAACMRYRLRPPRAWPFRDPGARRHQHGRARWRSRAWTSVRARWTSLAGSAGSWRR